MSEMQFDPTLFSNLSGDQLCLYAEPFLLGDSGKIPSTAVEQLLSSLESFRVDQQTYAIDILAKMDSPHLSKQIIPYLCSKHASVASAAFRYLKPVIAELPAEERDRIRQLPIVVLYAKLHADNSFIEVGTNKRFIAELS
jgi:hypothetical protein